MDWGRGHEGPRAVPLLWVRGGHRWGAEPPPVKAEGAPEERTNRTWKSVVTCVCRGSRVVQGVQDFSLKRKR